MHTGKQYAEKFKAKINQIGEDVTITYRKRNGYQPTVGETYEDIRMDNVKMLIRKTDRSDYEQLPEGLHELDVRKVYFYQKIPYKNATITRCFDNQEYRFITPPVENLFNGANIYYFAFIALKEVQKNVTCW